MNSRQHRDADSRPANDGLPDYAQPPLVETAIGVDFPQLQGWNVTHYGLLYQHFKNEYPTVVAQPPLPPQPDELAPPQLTPVQVSFSDRPFDTRCWFIDPTDTRLLQVQADRFLRNWRKRGGGGDYPHYRKNRSDFVRDWEHYLAFLQGVKLGEPKVRQAELTYINHLEPGGGWSTPGEFHKLFSFWKAPLAESYLPVPDNGSFTLSFKLPEKQGRMHVALQPAVRLTDGKELLQLTLTARGRPRTPMLEHIVSWFDLAHDWLLRGFDELTSSAMHQQWGKTVMS